MSLDGLCLRTLRVCTFVELASSAPLAVSPMSKPDADSVTSEAAKLLTKCRALSSRALVHSKRYVV